MAPTASKMRKEVSKQDLLAQASSPLVERKSLSKRNKTDLFWGNASNYDKYHQSLKALNKLNKEKEALEAEQKKSSDPTTSSPVNISVGQVPVPKPEGRPQSAYAAKTKAKKAASKPRKERKSSATNFMNNLENPEMAEDPRTANIRVEPYVRPATELAEVPSSQAALERKYQERGLLPPSKLMEENERMR